MTLVNVMQLYNQGLRELVRRHDEAESTTTGTLRVGNTGCVTEAGIIGSCPRKAYLRFLGIEMEEPDYERELMFELGRANEQLVVECLKAGGWNGAILQESECPVKWNCSGVDVTGRPDIVLADGEKYVHGVELKAVCSVWTARDVLKCKPKTNHLAQAAHYMFQLGIPYELLYVNRVDFATTEWVSSLLPNDGELNSEYLEHSKWQRKEVITKYNKALKRNEEKVVWDDISREEYFQLPTSERRSICRKVVPFKISFELRFNGGRLEYRQSGTSTWTSTIITTQGIRKYYEHIVRGHETRQLMNPPAQVDSDGSKASWHLCDAKYCPLSGICRNSDNNLDKWLTVVRCQLNA